MSFRHGCNYFDRISDENYTLESFDNALTIVYQEALLRGLEENILRSLVDAIIKLKRLSGPRLQAIFKSLIPTTVVSRSTLNKVIAWVLTYHRDISSACCVTALQWIIGLIEFDLIDKEWMRCFYSTLYFLLKNEPLVQFVCKLIYILTEARDVCAWRVKIILQFQKNYGVHKHTTALLCLFKKLRPDLVQEEPYVRNVDSSFKQVPEFFSFGMRQAKLRTNLHLEIVGSDLNTEIVWNTEKKIRYKARRLGCHHKRLIPDVKYLNMESETTENKTLKTVLEIYRNSELSQSIISSSLLLPGDLLSLLANEAGFLVLTFLKESQQDTFILLLQAKLENAFIDQETSISHIEKENLLKQLYLFESFIQEGLPVVSRFLSIFLISWNGCDYFDEIMSLIEWITFNNFERLHDDVLLFLRDIFISSEVSEQICVIRTLTMIISNIHNCNLYRQSRKLKPFSKSESDWDIQEILEELSNFSSSLFILGLNGDPENTSLLQGIMQFYDVVSLIESSDDILTLWSDVPVAIAYQILFSNDCVLIEQLSGICIRHMTIYMQIASKGDLDLYKMQTNSTLLLIKDILSMFWNGNVTSSDFFQTIPKNIQDELLAVIKNYNIQIIKNNIAFLPLVYEQRIVNDMYDDEYAIKNTLKQLVQLNI